MGELDLPGLISAYGETLGWIRHVDNLLSQLSRTDIDALNLRIKNCKPKVERDKALDSEYQDLLRHLAAYQEVRAQHDSYCKSIKTVLARLEFLAISVDAMILSDREPLLTPMSDHVGETWSPRWTHTRNSAPNTPDHHHAKTWWWC